MSFRSSLLAVLVLSLPPLASAQTQYAVTPIPPPAGAVSISPSFLNDSGQIAGTVTFPATSTAPPCGSRAFILSGGNYTLVDPLTGVSDCTAQTTAAGFNNQATLVGSSTNFTTFPDGESSSHAFIFTAGTPQDLNSVAQNKPSNLVIGDHLTTLSNSGLIGGWAQDLNAFSDDQNTSQPSFHQSFVILNGNFVAFGDAFSAPLLLSSNVLNEGIGIDGWWGDPSDFLVWNNGNWVDTGVSSDFPVRLSDSGAWITSTYSYGSQPDNANIWGVITEPDGSVNTIAPLPGDDQSFGDFLNSSGTALGRSGESFTPILWDAVNGTRNFNQLIANTGWTVSSFIALNNNGQILAWGSQNGGPQQAILVTPVSGGTTPGSNVAVTANNATVTFSNVTGSGTTTVASIDPSTAGSVPGGFALSNTLAYQISTTASFSGTVTLAFHVPGPISEADFDVLRILHGVNGTLVDITASTPARDYATLTIYGTTSSFSPFYVAKEGGVHVQPLFDGGHPVEAGRVLPVALVLLDGNNHDISSSSTVLTARGILRAGSSKLLPANAAGGANPQGQFRYVGVGGLGGYLYNLNTKGLAPGRYAMSFWVGADRSFVYTVPFTVR